MLGAIWMLAKRGRRFEPARSPDQRVRRRVDLAGLSLLSVPAVRLPESRRPDLAGAVSQCIDAAYQACRGNRPQSAGQVQLSSPIGLRQAATALDSTRFLREVIARRFFPAWIPITFVVAAVGHEQERGSSVASAQSAGGLCFFVPGSASRVSASLRCVNFVRSIR